MKKSFPFILAAMMAMSCSEPFDFQTKGQEKVYLCVEAALTDAPSVQTVRLSESIDYDSTEDVPYVSGAAVTVSDGVTTWDFLEREGAPGRYDSPKGFCCEKGKTYTLDVECELSNGRHGHYNASSMMPDNGFDIDRIDYKILGEPKDSTWVLGVWGKDHPETNYFLITTAVNGIISPTTSLLERSMLMPDTYFNNSYVSGFPIAYLYQNSYQYKKYGECAKPLKQGDFVSMVVYTLSKEYYDFITALSTASSGINIPVISSQPANIPTNITGGDAVGYFAACPLMIVTCRVDDPYRKEFGR